MKIEFKDKPAQRGLSTAAVNHGVNLGCQPPLGLPIAA
jgi:hypothetical protein